MNLKIFADFFFHQMIHKSVINNLNIILIYIMMDLTNMNVDYITKYWR